MASLYAAGWRQGSILVADLPLDTLILGQDGQPVRDQGQHGCWVVATQNCDLVQTETHDEEPTIELRPVFTDGPPPDWGLRSARLRLTDTEFVVSASPRPVVSAALLTALVAAGHERRDVAENRRRALTTWLGLRYDRPAVPDDLVALAKRIAEEVIKPERRPIGLLVRDVLMDLDDSTKPHQFSLYAVIQDDQDAEQVRTWLADIARAIPVELGVPAQLLAATAASISIETLEQSYAADVSRLTWRPNSPNPEGAM
jgi:hypothetical protein